MAALKSYQELEVWKKSIDSAEMVYRTSAEFPVEERFGLTSQVRRAATSIPANIAEGAERHDPREFLQFLSIASGSLAETETFLILALRLNLAKSGQIDTLLAQSEEVGRMLNGLKRSLRPRT